MDAVSSIYVRIVEGRVGKGFARMTASRGQTMTEYAMIIAVVAVVAYGGYQAFGTSTTALLTSIDGSL